MSEPDEKRQRCDSPRNDEPCSGEASELSVREHLAAVAARPAVIEPETDVKAQEIGVLPPEVWAHTMEYLMSSEVAKTALLSKSFLNDVMPLIRFLYLDQQETCKPLKRFKQVEEIVIDCLFDSGHYGFLVLFGNDWAFNGVLAFLLASLENVKHVFLGIGNKETKTEILQRLQLTGNPAAGYRYNDILHPNIVKFATGDSGGQMGWRQFVVNSLCAAYRRGFLPRDLMIHGLPGLHARDGPNCETCQLICSSFPMEQVATLTSVKNGYFPSELGGCYENTFIRIKALAERSGGREFLKSRETELLWALVKKAGLVSRAIAASTLEAVILFDHDALQAISTLNDIGCHVQNVSVQAFCRVFTPRPSESAEPRPLRRIEESVYQRLLEVGFPVDKCDLQVVPDVLCLINPEPEG